MLLPFAQWRSRVGPHFNARAFCYAAPGLSQNFTEKARRKAATIKGHLSENINAFLLQPVRRAGK